jgi:ethanolamine utilization microcompartment shell protein EutS
MHQPDKTHQNPPDPTLVAQVGVITGAAGVLLLQLCPGLAASLDLEAPQTAAALLGFLLGVCAALVLSGPVLTAVDTVLVCYAADPQVLQAHHPEEFLRCESAWRELRLATAPLPTIPSPVLTVHI